MQRLRNCSGKGSPAKVELNNHLYTRCPKAEYLESYEARYLFNLYRQCKDAQVLPAEGGALNQTAFAVAVFAYLDKLAYDQSVQESKKTNKSTR